MEHKINDTQRLAKLVEKIQFTMLTTVNKDDGSLRSRPMTLQEREFDGDFWFFASKHMAAVEDLRSDSAVNLAFADPAHSRYVSVVGMGEVVDDKAKAAALWKPALKAWFPEGLDDPELTLIRVQVESADFWETPSSKVVQLAGFAKAMLTGKRAEGIGEHGHVGAPGGLSGSVN
jgi:general stress protein 26